MGVVYLAHDPELDRPVAVKVLLGGRLEAQARIQREAQALAMLNHPNVVVVNDVGLDHGRVFIAMEYVEGDTLDVWLRARERGWREVVEVFMAAGRGLIAAHSVGLVHRDFKPANLMIATDGRVRVLDFGIARTGGDTESSSSGEVPSSPAAVLGRLTVTGALVGTPAYMPYEQLRAKPATALSDQFSFCASLFEALHGVRPFEADSPVEIVEALESGRVRTTGLRPDVPTWLNEIALRGLNKEPSRRFPDMKALVDALGRRGSGRRRRRLMWLGLGVAALGLAEYGRRQAADASRAVDCRERAAAVDAVWSADAREEVRTAAAQSSLTYATAVTDLIVPQLDEHAAAWRREAQTACSSRASWSAQRHERARWCLRMRLVELEGTAAELHDLERGGLDVALDMVGALTAPTRCTDDAAAARLEDPPPAYLRPFVVALAVDLRDAGIRSGVDDVDARLHTARRVATRARALGWVPLIARARIAEALALQFQADYSRAEAAAEEAYLLASGIDDWSQAAEAAMRMARLFGTRRGRTADGLRWASHAEVAIERADDRSGRLRALVAEARGELLAESGQIDEGVAVLEGALQDMTSALGELHPSVASVHHSLANAMILDGRLDAAQAHLGRAVEIDDATLGPEYPRTAALRADLAGVWQRMGRAREAKEGFEAAAAVFDASLGPDHINTVVTRINLGVVSGDLGDYRRAREVLTDTLPRLESTFGADHPNNFMVLRSLGVVEMRLGELDTARAHLLEALVGFERLYAPDHLEVSNTLAFLGIVEHDANNYDRAVDYYERTISALAGEDKERRRLRAEATVRLARTHLAQERPDEARRRLEVVRAELHAHGEDETRGQGAVLRTLGYVEEQSEDYETALSLHREALAIFDATLAEEHDNRNATRLAVGRVLLALGRPDDALAPLETALRVRAGQPDKLAELGRVERLLASALWDAKPPARDRTRARMLAERALEHLESAGLPDPDNAAKTRAWLQAHPHDAVD